MLTTHLSLIGMPGSGKSSAGRVLAKRLQMPFVDTDVVIEERLGCSIGTFFQREGEDAFRTIETEVIKKLCLQPQKAILSTGGGLVLRSANRQVLHEHTFVVYLHAHVEELARRLKGDTSRPLLAVANPIKKLRELYIERNPLYREIAYYVIETGRPSVMTLVNMIIMQLELSQRMMDLPVPPPQWSE